MAYTYVLKEDQKKEILEIIEQLQLACQQYRVPMFVSIVTGEVNGQTFYQNRMFSAMGHGINLSDDQIRKHILVADGFAVVPPRDHLELDIGSVMGEDEEESRGEKS